jgi:hypothetical protein
MKTASEIEAQATFSSFSKHLRYMEDKARAEFGENKWNICFDVSGEIVSLKDARLEYPLIILSGQSETCKYEFGQHFSTFRYTIYTMPKKDEDHVASIVKLVPKNEK